MLSRLTLCLTPEEPKNQEQMTLSASGSPRVLMGMMSAVVTFTAGVMTNRAHK